MALDLTRLCSTLFGDPGRKPVVLEIDLDRGVLRSVPDNPLQALQAINAPTMGVLTRALRQAATDDRVKGLVLHIGSCPLSAAQVDELGLALSTFSQTRPTIAYAESFGELASGMLAYRLATACQEIWLQPSGSLVLGGAHLDLVLLRGGLEKLGVEPEFSWRKEYKTAAEQYAAREISDANRERMQRIADSVVDETVAVVAQRRRLSSDTVREAVDQGPIKPDQAVELGLVDKIGYRDEVYQTVRERWGEQTRLQYAGRYAGSLTSALVEKVGSHKDAVALVDVFGPIVTGRATPSSPLGGRAGSETVCDHLRQAQRDPQVKAVVLTVSSPGGSYTASDTIRREVLRTIQLGKPVVASMGDMAASGGYFVSMGADEIVANPSTLTGSIGVFAGKMVTQGLYDKLGLVREDVHSGALAGMFAGNRGFTEEQWRLLDAWLDDVYADFTRKAATDRGMELDELEPLARGRVWTGADAVQRRLVDHLGGRELAVERACALAGLNRDQVQLKPVPLVGVLERLRPAESSEQPGGLSSAASLDLATPEGLARRLGHLLGLETAGVLTMPYRLQIR